MENLINFKFKVNPSVCEFEGDKEQMYEAFKLPEGGYLVKWETENGKYQVLYSKKEAEEAVREEDWIIKK